MATATRRSARAQRAGPGDVRRTGLRSLRRCFWPPPIGVALGGKSQPAVDEFDFRTSTYLSGPSGSKALHEILVGLGRLSERRRIFTRDARHRARHRPACSSCSIPSFLWSSPSWSRSCATCAGEARGSGGRWRRRHGVRGVAHAVGRPGAPDSIGVRARETDVRLPTTRRVLTVDVPQTDTTRGKGSATRAAQKRRRGRRPPRHLQHAGAG